MNFSAAIDFSTAAAVLAVGKADSDEILFTASQPMTGRDASSMLPWIIAQLADNDLTMDNITQWTCGTGPGSFTGLRLIASLIAGLTYGKDEVDVRGVPSGTAIADATSEPGEKYLVLYDGRRQELIGFTAKDEPMTIISIDNTGQLDSFDAVAAMESEKKAIEAIIPQELLAKVKFLSKFPVGKLLLNKSVPWHKNEVGNSFFAPDLVYNRPPV